MQVEALRCTTSNIHIWRIRKSPGRWAAMHKAQVDRVHLEDVKYLWEKILQGKRWGVEGGGEWCRGEGKADNETDASGQQAGVPAETPRGVETPLELWALNRFEIICEIHQQTLWLHLFANTVIAMVNATVLHSHLNGEKVLGSGPGWRLSRAEFTLELISV